MESATSKLNGNPKNVNYIGGIPVDFPYQPYGPQLAFMSKVISTLDRAQRDGHCHALLESPTGTGKSLSLLCSTLAWQKYHGNRDPKATPPPLKADARASNDPLNYGGGFCPESQPSSAPASESPSAATKGKNSRKKQVTTIFYASRTHSQISQVIREYRKTSYRVPMAVLASRKHYCTNKHVRCKENLDEECKLLLENRESGCPEFKNAVKVTKHPSIQKGGCHEVHDIEDLVKVGQIVKGCSYFAARSLATDAQLVFCPYSYIINPIIRRAMEVDIQGAVVILDEAHNIEDIAREAGSSEIDEDSLFKLQRELSELCLSEPMVYQPLYEMAQDISSWMEQQKSTLEKREFQHYFSSWSGDKALKELEAANLSRQCFPSLQECAISAIKATSDTESGFAHLSGMSATTLEGLFSSLSYFFGNSGTHVNDYQVTLRRFIKRNDGHYPGNWTYTFNLWCLNPAVVFKDIANASLSVILTSGTLSPMNSFSSELGVHFSASLEAPHVINIETQVWVGALSVGQGNYPMNASYKAADSYAFQDALGKTLEEIFNNVPGGSLVFFPSYKLMDKLSSRWHETGQWSRLTSKKPVFVEPKGGSQDDLEPVLRGYYDAIRFGSKPSTGRKKKEGKKTDSSSSNAEVAEACKKNGAAFLAVCRGKVSEGIDFSDEYARAVIIIGIPFPNIYDIQVAEKKKYNDMNRHSKQLLSGSDWYCHQAFRALNQAAGRCIRHRYDHGAIIFLDERYREERTTMFISKWLRKSIRQYHDFETSMDSLKSFFNNIKIGDKKLQAGSALTQDNLTPVKYDAQSVRMNQRSTSNAKLLSENIGKKTVLSRVSKLTAKHKASFPPHRSKVNDQNVASPLGTRKDWGESKEIIDLEFGFQESSRNPISRYMPCSGEGTQECCIVKETPCASGKWNMSGSESFSKDEASCSTIIQSSIEVEPAAPSNISPSSTVRSPLKVSSSTGKTPERYTGTRWISKIESPLNSSVNSYSLKKRKYLHSPFINLVEEETSGVSARTSEHISSNYKFNSDLLQSLAVEVSNDSFITSTSPIVDQVTSSPHLSADQNIEKANNDLTSRDSKRVDISSIDKYAFQSQSGWRSTKSKLRLPRRALLRNTESQD